MRIGPGLLMLLAALTASGPAAAQLGRELNDVGAWVAKFAAAMTEPNLAAATCAPQLQASMSRARDAASARTAMAEIKPCAARIRAAYAQSAVKLNALQPLSGTIAAGSVGSSEFIAEQRKLSLESVAQIDRVERLLEAIATNNVKSLPKLANDVRQGGAVLLDSNILMFRLQKEVSQFQSSRQIADLRILLAEAAKTLIVSPVSSNGIATGSRLSDLAGQAEGLSANLRRAWLGDQARLRPANGDRDVTAERVIANLEPMIAGVATDSDRLATTLANAGNKQTLSLAQATQLAVDLQTIELQIQTRAKAFASALVVEK